MTIPIAVCVLIALMSVAAPAAFAQTVTWRVGGDTREAIVYAPSPDQSSGRSPLVFAFHGRGDDVENFQYVRVHEAWPDAIVVYFQGLPNAEGYRGWQVEKGQDGDRDLRLVDVALASLREKFRVDDARIYATGFSNGAGFTYLLWAERPSVFAAYAPVAGRMRPSVQPKEPRPLFHVAGRRDPQIRFTDQRLAFEAAMRVNGVAGKSAPCGDDCTIYGAGERAPVMTWIHPGGHVYPNSTSERIARFFREHTRK
jgi:polyhydroxybutyrate depolymerase